MTLWRYVAVCIALLWGLCSAASVHGQVNVSIDTLPAGKSVTILFEAQINSPVPAGTTQIVQQGTVTSSNGPTVRTDDPTTATPADPTITRLGEEIGGGPPPPPPPPPPVAVIPTLSQWGALLLAMLLLGLGGRRLSVPSRRWLWGVVLVGVLGTTLVIAQSSTPTATLTDQVLQDRNGNGKIDAGDVLRYQAQISNPGGQDLRDVVFTLTVDPTTTLRTGTLNTSPIADDQMVAVPVDTSQAITLQGRDADGDTLTFVITRFPGQGQLTGTPPSITYTPYAGFSGSDEFRFVVRDAKVFANEEGSVRVNVGANQPPTATPQSVTTSEDTARTIGLTGTDPENHPLTFAIATQPSHGSVSGTPPSVTYTPTANYHGPDSFTFTANDGTAISVPATVAITVTPVNDAPLAAPASVTVREDTPVNLTLVGSDVENDPLTFSIVTPPSYGSLSGTPPNVTYTPTAGYHGPDSFTFRVNDGTVNSIPATIAITVSPVTNPPIAVPDAVTLPEDAPATVLNVLSNDLDPDGSGLNIQSVTQPLNGAVGNNGTTVSYTPNPNYCNAPPGTTVDTFTYTLTGGSVATVSVTVTCGNDAPVIDLNGPAAGIDYAAAFTEGTPALIVDAATLTVTDVDDTTLESATVTLTNLLDVGVETVAATTTGTNISAAYTGATGVLSLTGADSLANYQAVLRTLTYNNTAANPSPPARVITVVGTDGTIASTTATSTVTMNAVNSAPVFTKGADQTGNEDAGAQSIPGWATGIDDGDPGVTQTLTFNVTNNTSPSLFSAGPAISPTGVLTYTPAANATGSATITLTLSDNGGTANGGVDTSAPQTFVLTVMAVNDQPSFTASNPPPVNEGAGGQTLPNWATFSAGPANESSQTATYTVSNIGNAALFSTPPAVAPNGTLTYTPAAGVNGTSTFQVTVRDSGGTANGGIDTSAAQTLTITVTAVNDPPILTAGATLAYTENDPATVSDSTVTVSDGDSATLTGATIQLTGNYQSGQDVLAFTDTASITGTFAAATGTLTLSGNDSLVNYQTALRSVTYQNTSDNPSTASRTVTWVGSDGSTNSALVTSTITVTAVNDGPALTAGGTLNYSENDPATTIDTGLTVTDPDSLTLTGATVQMTGNYQTGQDVLGFTDTASITGVFTAATGTLALSGSDTVANYQAALRSVTYQNTSNTPVTTNRTVSWNTTDGTTGSNTDTSTINISASNDAPILTAGATLAYTENAPATVLDATVTVADPDDLNLTGATVQLTGNYQTGQDVLAFTDTASITGVFTAASGTLTLSGSDSLANYQTALRSVTYVNTSNTPTTTARTVTWIGTDGTTPSAAVTSTITVSAVNDAPVLTAGGTLAYTENQAAQVLDGTVTVVDADTGTLASATVQITSNYQNGADILAFANTASITGIFTAASGTLTLTGSDSLANYQAALRSVTYQNTSDNPTTTARTVTWLGNDGTTPSAPVTSTITITTVNDAPVLTAGGTLAYTENQAATVIDATVTVSDGDHATLTGATIQLTSNYQTGQDVLSFVNTASITGVFTAASGTLTLSGSDSLANYQTALRSVTYVNTSNTPTTTARTVTWIGTDGTTPSAAVTSTITVSAVNDAPVLTAGGTLAYTENQAAQVLDGTVTVVDADTGTLASATVQITSNYQNGADVLAFANTASITGVFTAASGLLTLTGTDSLANYQAALRSVTYTNSSENPSPASRTVTWVGNDGTNSSTPVTSTITVTIVNDAPVLTAGGTLAYTENTLATAIDTTVTVNDADHATLTGATIQLTANYQTGQDVLGFVNTPNITGVFTVASGTLTLSGSDTVANYQTALRNVTYVNTSDTPNITARTVTWSGTDGTTPSAAVTSTITVTAANDPPVLTAGATLAYTENQAAQVVDGTVTVTDPDDTNLESATVQITSNYQNGADVLACGSCGGIGAVFTPATGTLTLTGTVSEAVYQAALRSVTYVNTSENPTTGNRTVTWLGNDGTDTSIAVTSTITVTSVNDAPVLTAGGTLNYTENQAAAAIDTTVTVSDVDNANLAGATIQMTSNYLNGQDVLSFANTPNITGSFAAGSGTLTLSGTDTLANYQAALRNVRYANTSENPNTTNRTVTWQINDGGGVNNLSNTPTSTITVTAVNDPPAIASPPSYGVHTNIAMDVADGTGDLLDVGITDVDSAGPFTLGTVPSTAAGTGGTLGINANGSFHYNPGLNLTGAGTFIYQICDSGNPLPVACTNVTATVNVSGLAIVFVDDSAAGGGDGTLEEPLQTLAAGLTALSSGGGASNLFLFSGSYGQTAVQTLTDGVRIFGQGSTVADFDTLYVITPPETAPVNSIDRPALSQTRPVVSSTTGCLALAVGASNTLRGFEIGSCGGDALASGANFGTLTVPSDNMVINTTGRALNLTNGTLSATFSSITSTGGTNNINLNTIAGTSTLGGGALSGATGTAVNIDTGTGTLSYSGSITNTAAARLVNIVNKSGTGGVTLSGNLSGTGSSTGINVQNNTTTGTIAFTGSSKVLTTGASAAVTLDNNDNATLNFSGGGLVITTTSGAGFTASNGATAINVTGSGNTITSTTGTALNVANSTIGGAGLTFQSISANGGTNGIVLNTTGTLGGLTVTGNSAGLCGGSVGSGPPASAATTTAPVTADCTGGTIQSTSGQGIILTNTSNVSLTRVWLRNSGNDGLQGTNVTGFTLASSFFDNNGNALNENGLDFGDSGSVTPDGLHGTGSITNSTVQNSYYNGVSIRNLSGVALTSFNITGSQFRSLPANGDSNDNVFMEAGGTANMAISVTGSFFASIEGDHFQAAALNSGTLNVNFTNNTLTGGHSTPLGQGITINAATGVAFGGYTGRIDYDVNGNNIQGATSNGVSVVLGTSGAAAVFDGFVRNNIIGTSGSALSCSTQANGVYIDARGNGTHNSAVTGNTIRQCFDRGILSEAGDGDSVLNLTVQSNIIDQQVDAGAREAIQTNYGITSTNVFGNIDTNNVCLQLGGTGALANVFSHGGGAPDDFRLRNRFEATVRLPGYGGSEDDTAAVVLYIQGRNTGSAGEPGSATASVTAGAGYFGGAACTLPSP